MGSRKEKGPAGPGAGLRVRVWGARGSLPVFGDRYRQFGGSTTCIEVRCGGHLMFFDAGSGLPAAGQALKAEGIAEAQIFFSHCHYDHIMGLPFFPLLFDPAARVALWSGHLAGTMTTREMVASYMRPPWFPVEPDSCRAGMITHDFRAGDVLRPYPDVAIRTAALIHPGGAIGYRVEWGGRALAIVTDTEHRPGQLDPSVLDLIRGADLFLYDSTYTEAEMATHAGFGHSTWNQALRLALAAGVRQVGFMHHAPWRGDDELMAMEAEAQARFAAAFFAREGQVIDL